MNVELCMVLACVIYTIHVALEHSAPLRSTVVLCYIFNWQALDGF